MKPIVLAAFILAFATQLAAAEQALTVAILSGPQEVLKRVEISIQGVPSSTNPYHPTELTLDLEASAPSGKTLLLPAFWGRDFERKLEGGREILSPKGEAGWRARYLPLEAGRHELRLVARRGGELAASGSVVLEVAAARRPGLVRVDAGGRSFCFDDGTPLFLNGLCACWHGRRGTFDYDDWLAAYEKAGINYIRIWMWPHAFGIEWDKGDRVQYRLDSAWTLDRVLTEAEARGVLVMLCFDYHGMFEVTPDYWKSNNYWPSHPYNVASGGPCATQDEFFTKEQARELYRHRLRYIVARWSAFSNVFAWEFFNEIDNVYKYLKHEHVVDWHRVMGAYLRSIDPYQHLISSSFTGGSERPDLFALKEMDFSQYHSYNEKHPAEMIAQKTAAFWGRYKKPFFVSEYGTDWKGWKPDTDPHLRALHQAIWSGAFTGAAGTGMTWWWESIHSANLYRHWSALSKFLDGTAVGARDMRPVPTETQGATVKAWTVATSHAALVWILDPAMNWPEGAMVDSPPELAGGRLAVQGLEDGVYSVEWWNTLDGKPVHSSEARCNGGRLTLGVPPFRVDIAARMRKR